MDHLIRRPDVDIEEEIDHLVRSFAPLKASHIHFAFHSVDGKVTLLGNVRSPQARRVLIDNIPRIEGVVSLDHSKLFDDELVRFAVGQLLPPGIYASVQYGAVALTGRIPDGVLVEAIIDAVEGVPGVTRVGADFGQAEEKAAT